MTKNSLTDQAATQAAKTHKLKQPLVVDRTDSVDPESGKPIHLFKVVASADANGPAYTVALNDAGHVVKTSRKMEAFHGSHPGTGKPPKEVPPRPRPVLAAITVQPDENILTLNAGETVDETLTVTIPKNAGSAMADVYFLADTTGSMGGILAAVQAGANNVLATLSGLGVDMVFGVGNYKDFGGSDPFCFQHQLSPTNVAAQVTNAINGWSASGGGDGPEGQLFALDSLAVPAGGSIGWRAGSKRIIVWFGDVAGHDPICSAISGLPAPITEASATGKLTAEGITVLAISTANPGLDDDPTLGANDYVALCGPAGGLAGQGTRIATNTGGAFVTGINAGNIVNTIISLVTSAVAGIQNVNLVPSASIAQFVTSINPAAGYGPLAGDKDHTLKFQVRFTGIPCRPTVQVFTGTIDVVADGKVVASKRVRITVPPCAFVYSVKFICGVQPECDCECSSVQPGNYSTEINIHNYSLKEVRIVKRFIPVVLAGAPAGREPRIAKVRAEDKIVLPRQTATMDDCCRIAELLYGGEPPSPIPLTIGFLELTTSAEVAVTAVYTTSGLKSGGVSIALEQITRQRQ